ncbi:MAG: periplasmic heavy metal sensor [Bacteroidetes bacterium]|nr:periplasmic heavy metal sensor [Bacteroidota bacterium]
MNKTRLLSFAVVILFLMNIGMISFFLLNRPPRPDGENRGDGPKRMIIDRLRFDKEQIDRYDALIEEHQRAVRSADEEIMQLKRELFSQISSPDPSREDSLIVKIGDVQRRIEHAHIAHFSGIRMICRPDQLNDFNGLSRELAQLFSPKERRPR